MIGALYNGLAGLTSEQKALNNESNNIANVNTIGYKSTRISFGDMIYQNGTGKGAHTIEAVKQYSQGTIKRTGNSYDFAIEGDGFFTVEDELNSVFYTRAGNFQRGVDGYLKTSKDMNVLGIATSVSGDKITSEFNRFIGGTIVENDNEVKTINSYITDLSSNTSAEDLSKLDKLISDYSSALLEYSTTQTSASKDNVDNIYNEIKQLVENNGGKVASNISTITKAKDGTINQTPLQVDLTNLNISDDSLGELDFDNGIVYMKQGRAKYAIGQLTPVVFRSNAGLDPKGDNIYMKTSQSGEPQYIASRSVVVNKNLELSTEDLSEGLVNMVVFQKAFEANSKSISTSDQFLQTAIQMKK